MIIDDLLQLTHAKSKSDSCASEGQDDLEAPQPGAIVAQVLRFEPYWEEDFNNRVEWQMNIGRSSRKPSLDDYDRWAH